MPSRSSTIISFFNTALGLWILSTVAVGFISTGYSVLTAHLADSSKKDAQILRLHVEILQRMAQLSGRLDQISDVDGYDKNKPDEKVAEAVASFLGPPVASSESRYPIYSAFEEYKGRPIVSLLVEITFLQGRKKSRNMKPSIEDVSSLTQEKLNRMSYVDVEERLTTMFYSGYWIDYADQSDL